MFQLCTLDEYGAISILETSKETESLVTKAKFQVNDTNMQNALTLDEQKKSFTAAWAEFRQDDDVVDNVVYSGRDGRGRHRVTVLQDDEQQEIPLKTVLKSGDLSVRFYIGTVVRDRANGIKDDYYAATPRGDEIHDIDHGVMEAKTFFFIKSI